MREDQEEFVRAENIRNFRRKLEIETDPEKRRVLIELIEQERLGRKDEGGIH